MLEAAAVVGKEFFVGAVRDLVPEDARAARAVGPDGARPQGADPARAHDAARARTRSGSATCSIRDAAYEAIPKAQRAELHERFADWLERVAGEAVVEQEEIVALPPRAGLRVPDAARPRRRALGRDRRPRGGAPRLGGTAGRRAAAIPAAANLLRRAVDSVPTGDAERARSSTTSASRSTGRRRPRAFAASTRRSGSRPIRRSVAGVAGADPTLRRRAHLEPHGKPTRIPRRARGGDPRFRGARRRRGLATRGRSSR